MGENIPNAINLLRKSVDEDIPRLKNLKHDDPAYALWESRIRTILQKTFGTDAPQCNEFNAIGTLKGTFGTDRDYEKQYLHRLNKRDFFLKLIIQYHEVTELLTAPGNGQIQAPVDSIQMANFLFDKMQFHPKVIEVSRKLYVDEHYAQAIQEAYKAVDNFVKNKTGLSIYGKDLMGKVFNVAESIIMLNELRTKSNRNEQEGFMYLFQGAMIGIRNPKAHDNVVMTDPYQTLEYLGFASLLIRRADEGKLVRTRKNQSKAKET